MSHFIGIDFGTSTLFVTRWNEEKQIAEPVPNLIPSEFGSSYYIENVVYYEESGNLVLGRKASKLMQMDHWNGVSEIKRHLDDDTWFRDIRGVKKTADDITQDIFSYIQTRLDVIYGGEAISSVVISVPYAFEPIERKKIETAAKNAGLPVVGLIEEPVAAALSSGLFDDMKPGTRETVLVFDLGGGTFDVTLFEAAVKRSGKRSVKVINTDGENRLGGVDVDNLLAEKLLGMMDVSSIPVDGKFRVELLEEARQTKLALSNVHEHTIFKKFESIELPFEQKISRSMLEGWLEGNFLYKINNVLSRLLDDANMVTDEIDQIILVGGSSNIPIISKKVRTFFGKRPKMIDDPGQLVGNGAAIYCGIVKGSSESVEVVRRTSHGFGVMVGPKNIKHILQRNEVYSQYSPFYDFTIPKGKARGRIMVYQGNSNDIEDCSEVGHLVVTGSNYSNGIIRLQLKMSESGLLCYRTLDERSNLVSEGEVVKA